MNWKQEQQALEDAFVRQLLVKYNIKDVTTQRQALNGTREFEFPVSTYNNTNECYKKWLKKQGRSLKDTPRLRIACFKSGYVRKQNGTYSPYQLNKTYNQNRRHTYLTKDGLLFQKFHQEDWKGKFAMIDKFKDERMVTFDHSLRFNASPEILPKEVHKNNKRRIASRI